ncbi:MAG TPA: hypothetical protein VFZ30_02915 [Acidimicrobiales bacterium]
MAWLPADVRHPARLDLPSGHHRVYIDPPGQPGEADAVVSWWVVNAEVGGPLEATLAEAVPSWLGEAWPFTRVRYGV